MMDAKLTQSQVDQIVQTNIATQQAIEHSNKQMEKYQEGNEKRMDKMQECIDKLTTAVSDINLVQNEQIHINSRIDEVNSVIKQNENSTRSEIVKLQDTISTIQTKDIPSLITSTSKNTDVSKKVDKLFWVVVVAALAFVGSAAIQVTKTQPIDYGKIGNAITESLKSK